MANGLALLEVTTSPCGGQAGSESSEVAATVCQCTLTMGVSSGLTTDSQSTMMACMVGVIGKPPRIFVLDGVLSDLRCLNVVGTLGFCSGTKGLILPCDGLL